MAFEQIKTSILHINHIMDEGSIARFSGHSTKTNLVKETIVAESEDCVYLNAMHPSLISEFIVLLMG